MLNTFLAAVAQGFGDHHISFVEIGKPNWGMKSDGITSFWWKALTDSLPVPWLEDVGKKYRHHAWA